MMQYGRVGYNEGIPFSFLISLSISISVSMFISSAGSILGLSSCTFEQRGTEVVVRCSRCAWATQGRRHALAMRR